MKYKYKVTASNDTSCIMSSNSNKDFVKLYEDNTVVEADKSTLGLMVFKTKENALALVERWSRMDILKIKRVIPLSRGRTPKEIGYADMVRQFYELRKNNMLSEPYTAIPPEGTICYHKLRVVGDC